MTTLKVADLINRLKEIGYKTLNQYSAVQMGTLVHGIKCHLTEFVMEKNLPTIHIVKM